MRAISTKRICLYWSRTFFFTLFLVYIGNICVQYCFCSLTNKFTEKIQTFSQRTIGICNPTSLPKCIFVLKGSNQNAYSANEISHDGLLTALEQQTIQTCTITIVRQFEWQPLALWVVTSWPIFHLLWIQLCGKALHVPSLRCFLSGSLKSL